MCSMCGVIVHTLGENGRHRDAQVQESQFMLAAWYLLVRLLQAKKRKKSGSDSQEV